MLKILGASSTKEEALEVYKELIQIAGYSCDQEPFSKIDPNFFEAPASSKFHFSIPHGLLKHSCNVAVLSLKFLLEIRKSGLNSYLSKMSEEEFNTFKSKTIICALYHDYCKVDVYQVKDDSKEFLTESQLFRLKRDTDIPEEVLRLLSKKEASDIISMANTGINYDSYLKSCLAKDSKNFKYIFKDPVSFGHGFKSVIYLLRLGFDLDNEQIEAISKHMSIVESEGSIERAKDFSSLMLSVLILADFFTGVFYEN